MKTIILLIIPVLLSGCAATDFQAFANQIAVQQQQNYNAATQKVREDRARLDRINDNLINHWGNQQIPQPDFTPKTYQVRDQYGNVSTYTMQPR